MKRLALIALLILAAVLLTAISSSASPAVVEGEATEASAPADRTPGMKALAAALVVGLAAAAGTIGMAIAIAKSTEGMARQPEASGKINSAMMLGLLFIETAIIYALIVAILIIFVL